MAGSRALVVSVISVAAHSVVLALLFVLVPEMTRRAGPRAPVIDLIEPVREPPADIPISVVDLAILDDRATPGATAAPVPPTASTSTSSTSSTATATGTRTITRSGGAAIGSSVEESSGDTKAAPTRQLAMRGLRHDLSLSGDAMTRILDAHEHPLPQPVKPSGHIRQHGRESEIDDAVAHYRVHGDGTVSIENKKDIDLHWKIHIPTPSRILRFVHDVGREVGDWYEDPYRDAHVGTTSELPAHLQAVPGSCSSWGDPMCDADAPVKITKPMDGSKGGTIPVLGGGMDITSWLYRKYVGDPYSSRKLKMLDETRAERAQAGAVHRADQLARSAELMTRNLEALWRATGDPALRRRALFELWDECTEGKSSAGQAGERARAMVIGWIRAKLPAGSAGAFTADEITRLDAHRTSKQHFTPYD